MTFAFFRICINRISFSILWYIIVKNFFYKLNPDNKLKTKKKENEKLKISIHPGKYINYDGDIDDDEEVLDWLTSPANMEMTDHIEQVNRKMFQKIRKASDYLAVIFC